MVPKHGSVTSRELDPSCLHLKARTEGRCRPKARQPCGLNCSQHSMESNTPRINTNHVIKVATTENEASWSINRAPHGSSLNWALLMFWTWQPGATVLDVKNSQCSWSHGMLPEHGASEVQLWRELPQWGRLDTTLTVDAKNAIPNTARLQLETTSTKDYRDSESSCSKLCWFNIFIYIHIL